MYQIDVPSAAATLPAPAPAGTPGYFTNGNPAGGIAPTTFPADMANALMLEILNAITAANIMPSKGIYTQLRDAIYVLAILAQQRGAYAIDTGAVNALVASPTIPAAALGAGLTCSVLVGNSNTGPITLNWSGLGAKPVKFAGAGLTAGALVAGSVYVFEYDGTSFQLVSPEVATTIPAASTSAAGIVALATAAEAKAGVENSKAATSADIAAAVQSNAYNYSADTGYVNVLRATLSPAPAALTAGMVVSIKAAGTNTAPPTLNVNAFGDVAIRAGGQPLAPGRIVSGQIYSFIFDGTAWEMLSPPTPTASFGIPGYRIGSDGFIEQWGVYASPLTGEFSETITFPIPFPNACLGISAMVINPSGATNGEFSMQEQSISQTTATLFSQDHIAGGNTGGGGFRWRAWGY